MAVLLSSISEVEEFLPIWVKQKKNKNNSDCFDGDIISFNLMIGYNVTYNLFDELSTPKAIQFVLLTYLGTTIRQTNFTISWNWCQMRLL